MMAPGLVVAGLAIWLAYRGRGQGLPNLGDGAAYRLPLLTGLTLLVCGTAIYLPMNALAGSYKMPAIWGADILLAVLLTALLSVPLLFWRRLALGLVLTSLAAVAVTNLGRQEKMAARNALLWQALEVVEQEAPPHTHLLWVGTPEGASTPAELLISEAFHFHAHLQGRGRPDIDIRTISRQEEKSVTDGPLLLLSATPDKTAADDCRLVHEFQTRYWAGHRSFKCYLLRQDAGAAPRSVHEGG